jgi:catechol 2,3-dioxygenase
MSTPESTSTTDALLPDATRLGPVHLTVTDLARSVAFYEEVIGLGVTDMRDGTALLGDALALHEERSARRAGRHAGLYHVALRFPTRAELARVAVRIAVTRTPIEGASDHGTHEAIYLADPDGNGLELAWDRDRSVWPSYEEQLAGGIQPLDVQDLLSVVASEQPSARAADGVAVGHVHLHVGDLEAATRFYRDGLGFEVQADLGTAVFVSAGGYHHHVGFNVWRGQGIPPQPDGVVGFGHWTLVVPEDLGAVRGRLEDIGAVVVDHPDGLLTRDPSGIAVVVIQEEGEDFVFAGGCVAERHNRGKGGDS